jgi:hypothetical protein
MATNTNIQYLEATGKDELGATVSVGAGTSHRRQVETFIAGGSITAGDCVVFDVSKTDAARVLTVIQSPATAGQSLVCGFALNTAASGEKVSVVVEGYMENANVVSGVLTSVSLTTSGVTAGRALTYASGTHTATAPFAVTLEAASVGNTADVWVLKRF